MSGWKHHRLKEARLDAHTIIGIPDDWSFGRDETNDRFWCGREDEAITLFVQNAVVDAKGREPEEAMARNVSHSVKFLNDLEGLQGDVEVRFRSPREACIHAVVDHEEDDASFRTFRWYFFRHLDAETIAHLRFVLSMPSAESNEPANRELVEIFAEQMTSVATGEPMEDPLWARAERWRNLPEVERRECRRNWHKLRIAKPFGFIRLLVPENWPVDQWDGDAGMWCLCDEPDDEVTLWIDYHVVRSGGPIDAAALVRISEEAKRVRPPHLKDRGRVPHRSGGPVQRSVHMSEEKGELLRHFRWEVTTRWAQGFVVIYFALVISPSLQDTADEALLVRIFDEETPNSEIGDPPVRRKA